MSRVPGEASEEGPKQPKQAWASGGVSSYKISSKTILFFYKNKISGNTLAQQFKNNFQVSSQTLNPTRNELGPATASPAINFNRTETFKQKSWAAPLLGPSKIQGVVQDLRFYLGFVFCFRAPLARHIRRRAGLPKNAIKNPRRCPGL